MAKNKKKQYVVQYYNEEDNVFVLDGLAALVEHLNFEIAESGDLEDVKVYELGKQVKVKAPSVNIEIG